MKTIKYEATVKSVEAPIPAPMRPPSRDMSMFPQQVSLAMAYIPFQRWENLYTPEIGFDRGTLFADLDKPFIGEVAPK